MTCSDFERHLDGWLADNGLAPVERAAFARHLEGCARCRELAELAALSAEPVDPGPGFVDAVLARTVGAPAASARRARGASGARSDRESGRWPGLWSRLVQRPRFALEAAYVLTLVVAPLVLWAGAPARAAELAGRAGRAGSVAVTTASRDLTAQVAERAGSLGAGAGDELRTFGTRVASSLERGREHGPNDPNAEKGDAP